MRSYHHSVSCYRSLAAMPNRIRKLFIAVVVLISLLAFLAFHSRPTTLSSPRRRTVATGRSNADTVGERREKLRGAPAVRPGGALKQPRTPAAAGNALLSAHWKEDVRLRSLPLAVLPVLPTITGPVRVPIDSRAANSRRGLARDPTRLVNPLFRSAALTVCGASRDAEGQLIVDRFFDSAAALALVEDLEFQLLAQRGGDGTHNNSDIQRPHPAVTVQEGGGRPMGLPLLKRVDSQPRDAGSPDDALVQQQQKCDVRVHLAGSELPDDDEEDDSANGAGRVDRPRRNPLAPHYLVCPANAVDAVLSPASFDKQDARLAQESYVVRITARSILVEACHWHGLLQALRTLYQLSLSGLPPLLPSVVPRVPGTLGKSDDRPPVAAAEGRLSSPAAQMGALPLMVFEDRPSTLWRGQHLDLARNFVEPALIHRVLRDMALTKLNVLHLHLSDDQGYRVESLMFPQLPRHGGRRGAKRLNGVKMEKYRDVTVADRGNGRRAPQEGGFGQAVTTPPSSITVGDAQYLLATDVRWLVQEAGRRGISIVPEVDLPAHATALIFGLEADLQATYALGGAQTGRQTDAQNGAASWQKDTQARFAKLPPARLSVAESERVFNAMYPRLNTALQEAEECRTYFAQAQALLDRGGARDAQAARPRSGKDTDDVESADSFGGTTVFTGFYALSNDDCDGKADVTAVERVAVNCMGGVHGIVKPTPGVMHCLRAVLAEVSVLFGDVDALHIGGDQADGIRELAWGPASRLKALVDAEMGGRQRDNGGVSAHQLRDDKGAAAAFEDDANQKEQKKRSADADGDGEAAGGADTGEVGVAATASAREQTRFTAQLASFVHDTLGVRPIVWDDAIIGAYSGPEDSSVIGPYVGIMLWRDDRLSAVDVLAALRARGASWSRRQPAVGASPPASYVIYAGKSRLYFDYVQGDEAPAASKRRAIQTPPTWYPYRAVTLSRAYSAAWAVAAVDQARDTADTDATMVSFVGVQSCLWTELVTDDAILLEQLLPRMYATAEASWAGGPPDDRPPAAVSRGPQHPQSCASLGYPTANEQRHAQESDADVSGVASLRALHSHMESQIRSELGWQRHPTADGAAATPSGSTIVIDDAANKWLRRALGCDELVDSSSSSRVKKPGRPGGQRAAGSLALAPIMKDAAHVLLQADWAAKTLFDHWRWRLTQHPLFRGSLRG